MSEFMDGLIDELLGLWERWNNNELDNAMFGYMVAAILAPLAAKRNETKAKR